MWLFEQRWAIRILANLHDQRGARFVVMKNSLELPSESLSRSLDSLINRGLVQRNPGYGHPLRPEYILTAAGTRLGPWCSRFQQTVQQLQAADVVYRKWSVAVLLSVDAQPRSFSSVRRELGVSPRALSQCFERLLGAELASRHAGYATTSAGGLVVRAAGGILGAGPEVA